MGRHALRFQPLTQLSVGDVIRKTCSTAIILSQPGEKVKEYIENIYCMLAPVLTSNSGGAIICGENSVSGRKNENSSRRGFCSE